MPDKFFMNFAPFTMCDPNNSKCLNTVPRSTHIAIRSRASATVLRKTQYAFQFRNHKSSGNEAILGRGLGQNVDMRRRKRPREPEYLPGFALRIAQEFFRTGLWERQRPENLPLQYPARRV
ncbi:hypothetical protein [Celeribacter neptunius]|uniref:hypothetical protein n=1 Tax=Celeribacter neptunius TaxID=588602 RepID=UPI0015A50056|nr:hypothetical protein [Celeribacter neptunius]